MLGYSSTIGMSNLLQRTICNVNTLRDKMFYQLNLPYTIPWQWVTPADYPVVRKGDISKTCHKYVTGFA